MRRDPTSSGLIESEELPRQGGALAPFWAYHLVPYGAGGWLMPVLEEDAPQ